ncbi:DgyrCDS4039 [Dimorphilus gyrociliatus]|uniref:DgyrCDS4039 n=2 Tax=Dimorphilus gyrociliatus TaxID=2664684 RepID=A0A7I8VFQ2_9ANNE|nr:DgyrCDS4039 [Dimorphilus gyrociliatus]
MNWQRKMLSSIIFILYLGVSFGLDDPLFNKKKYLELSVVCDKGCYSLLVRGGQDPVQHMYKLISETEKIMAQLNVQLIVTDIEIWNAKNMIPFNADLKTYMLGMRDYREESLNLKRWSDATLLVTGYIFRSELGWYMFDAVCSKGDAVGVVRLRGSRLSKLEAVLTAHELGHGLGLNHDETGKDCCESGDGNCVMAPIVRSSNAKFGRCSIERFAYHIRQPYRTCLFDKPTYAMNVNRPNKCGNGVVDENEECDCGASNLNNCATCCDMTTCKLSTGSACYEGDCCDTSTCQFQPSTHTCKQSVGDCDIADKCSGSSAQCIDTFKSNGHDCSDKQGEKGYCLSGICSTKTMACQAAWNSDYKAAHDSCYRTSLNWASEMSHCGSPQSDVYSKCTTGTENNFQCGLLQCDSDNTNYVLEIQGSQRAQSYRAGDKRCLFIQHGGWDMEVGKGSGPYMVPDGTKCGDGKACYKQACLDKSQAYDMIKSAKEQNTASTSICGNGVKEDGEECDCGATQCGCCNQRTCKLEKVGSKCLTNDCKVCDGASIHCPSAANYNRANFEKCDSENGQCFKGLCRSLRQTCKKYFGESAEPDLQQIKRNALPGNYLFNGGGFLILSSAGKVYRYYEFKPTNGDGVCGVVHCILPYGTNPKISNYPTRGYTSRRSSSYPTKMAYFSNLSPFSIRGVSHRIYYPLMNEMGAPCKTNTGASGVRQTISL